ncbi:MULTISPECIES: sensor histidine kinase [unclassified Streptomyces]|uniref:sensor histidine kinase n=1 Tax=unclassified Streptomyces TaxID=2593676 RepID=UPI00093EB335|nr:histidine kinase [Streptomyces sp. CB02058]OKI98603.1 histidine kinase [Streptomyces sp. CB02058]
MWPAGRIAGEAVLSLALALLGAATGLMDDYGAAEAVGIGLAAALLSPLRRALPATVLLATAVGSAAISGLAPLVLVASWSAGRRIEGLGRAAGVFTLAYGLSLGLSVLWEMPHLSPSLVVFAGLVLLVPMFLPGLAGRYWSQRRTLTDTLHEYNAQLVRERAMIAGHARIRERQRIAQDMHDSLGHQLALIAVHTGALEVDRELTASQREAVGVLREASVAAMHELRDVVGVLRDGTGGPASRDTGEYGEGAGSQARGPAGVDGLVDASRSAGAVVELRRAGDVRPLAPSAGHAAYRVVQEGLTNAHKHAPGAAIVVGVRYEPDSLVVEVANGPADRPQDRGMPSGRQGLTGLGERARLVGGMVHAGPTADGGFRLAAVLPYPSAGGDFPSPPHDEAPATFVGPADDFWAQIPAGPLGESDPVIERSGLPKELVRVMSRSKRGSGIAIGCGVAAVAAVALVAAAVVGGILLMRETDKAMIEPAQYEAVEIGEPETEVRDQLPRGDSFLNSGPVEDAPPVPEGATCLTLLSTEFGSSWDKEPMFRFCFKDGRLVEKVSFETRI